MIKGILGESPNIMRDFERGYKCGYANGRASLIKELKEKIEKASYEHWFEFGEYLGEDCEEIKIINFDKCIEILNKYIGD